MNDRDEYPLRDSGRRPRRNIEFSDREFDEGVERPGPRGLRDGYPGGEYYDRDMVEDRREYYPGEEYCQHEEYRPRKERRPLDEYEGDRDGYRAGGRGGKAGFRKRHPVFMHFLYAAGATILSVWVALWFLDFWTFHGQERAVPDVKGQSLGMAIGNISRAGLRSVVTDSIYDSYARPGTVVEQSPVPLARIKRGGTVYLTLVAYTPKMVAIPDFYDVSERQARSMLEGLGITQVMTVNVPSEYAGLVLGARFNGVSLRPGAKVPVTAVITLEVGEGMEDVLPDGEIVDTLAIEQTIEALNID